MPQLWEPREEGNDPPAGCHCFWSSSTQTFQNPLIKEYTLNHNRIPNMIRYIPELRDFGRSGQGFLSGVLEDCFTDSFKGSLEDFCKLGLHHASAKRDTLYMVPTSFFQGCRKRCSGAAGLKACGLRLHWVSHPATSQTAIEEHVARWFKG